MCGIVYSQSFTGMPVNNDILQQFDLQRHRGTEGFGIYDGQELNMVHATKEDKILKWLCKYDSNLLLMHHRYPTSTKNVKRAAHPFSTKDYFDEHEYILVHNGVISNPEEMREGHEKRYVHYQSDLDDGTFNDSESLLWDFALTMEGVQESPAAIGRLAFICLKKTNGVLTHMYFGRNAGSPLKMLWNDEKFSLSSEGEGTEVPVDTLHTFDYATKQLTTSAMKWEQYDQSWKTYDSRNYGSVVPYGGGYDSFEDDEEYETYPSSMFTFADEDDDELTLRSALRNRINKILRRREDAIEYAPNPDTQVLELVDRPDLADVEVEALNYLAHYGGHFEQAYWAMECDYEDICNAPDSPANLAQMRLIEATMCYIMDDPEYIDENSISSAMDSPWMQTA